MQAANLPDYHILEYLFYLCESSAYGSELVVMPIAKDMISALRIKLKCVGIPLSGPKHYQRNTMSSTITTYMKL